MAEPLSRANIAERVRNRVAESQPVERPEVVTNAPTPRAQAISDWFMAATIHAPDGAVLVSGHALLGNRETADEYALQVDEQLDRSLDEVALTQWMLDYNRGGAGVRMFGLAPLIAADLLAVLRDLGFA